MLSFIRILFLAVLIPLAVPASSAFTQDSLAHWIKTCSPFDFVLIDVRDPGELESTGVIGSDRCKPYNLSLNQGTLSQNVSKLDKIQNIIIYCRSGSRASSAVSTLKSQGYTNVLNAGGIATWKDQSLLISATLIKLVNNLPEASMTATNQCQTSIAKVEYTATTSSQNSRPVLMVFNNEKLLPSGFLFDLSGKKAAGTIVNSTNGTAVSSALFVFTNKNNQAFQSNKNR
jgi:rhodanese-related sulfurtransferase